MKSETQAKHMTPEALKKDSISKYTKADYDRGSSTSYNPRTSEIGLSQVWLEHGSYNTENDDVYYGAEEIETYTVRGSANCQEKFVDLVYYNFNYYPADDQNYGPNWDEKTENLTALQADFAPEAQRVCDLLNKSGKGSSRVAFSKGKHLEGYAKNHFWSEPTPQYSTRLEARCFIKE